MNDFLAEMKQKETALEKRDAKAKDKGTLIGRYISHPYADGAAIYTIIKITRTKARIQVEDIGDAWVLPAWGRETLIPLTQARAFVAQRDATANLFARTDDWWAQQQIGTVVHYADGFGQYVRGVIVEHEGEKKMQVTALVGNWIRPLWTRRVDGSVHYDHYAWKVLDGDLMQPNASNMVEYPEHRLRGEDPRGMAAISLDVPPMTPPQELLAELAKLRDAVTKALVVESTNDVAELTARMKASLLAAKTLLVDAAKTRYWLNTGEIDDRV